ncbi:hemin uptake protein HemP [Ramlibacter tataouinensis]|uniref:hemin uptake protein HemP n=1 Tax=Ramlibacter tataouinensis TaxID=94132 RepID=UPI00300DDE9F
MNAGPAAPAPPGEPRCSQAPAPPPAARKPLDSDALLAGNRWVEIRHQGEVYRLQATRLGKLILTK